MKRGKKVLKLIAFLLLLVLLLRGCLFRHTVKYIPFKERTISKLTNQKLIQELEEAKRGRILSIHENIELARNLTNQKLSFSARRTPKDLDTIITRRKTNCIGYAALFGSIVLFIVEQQQQEGQYQVKHKVGKVTFLGMDLHLLWDEDPFWKDHDYNEIEDLRTGEKIYIDPVVSDYLRIHTVTASN